MKEYKVFEKDIVCGDKHYAEKTVFEDGKAIICENETNLCAEPVSALCCCPPESGFSEPAMPLEAEAGDNRKYAAKKLKIGAKISLRELINAQVDFDFEKAENKIGCCSAEDCFCDALFGKKASSAALGVDGKAKARLGSWITLAEWEKDSEGWRIAAIKTAQIDGKKLKADTWYTLKNGEFEKAK